MTNLICWSLRDVRYRHAGAARNAVDNVTLTVQRSMMIALVGPNGAGKSTLLQLMVGALAPDRGSVEFVGEPIAARSRRSLAREIGVVPQGETEPPFTVREVVAMGRYPHLARWQRERTHDIAAIEAAMARCSVDQFADRWFTTLSGGERQRVRLARALAQETNVLVLDEPTASLDVRHEMSAFEILAGLRDEGTTIVVVTHNLNVAARYADELALMHGGRVVACGSPNAVLTAERVSGVYEWPVDVSIHSDGAHQVVPQRLARCRSFAPDKHVG